MVNSDGPWPIRLRRSPTRLALVTAVRAAIGLVAIATSRGSPGVVGITLAVAGFIVLGYTAFLIRYLSSLTLEAAPGELRLRSLFGVRRYPLAPGPVTRVRLSRSWRSPLEATLGGFGVHLGEGELHGERLVGVIALARSESMLMVPVVGGRLAVAPASEQELLTALKAVGSFVGVREPTILVRVRRS